jgi:hypothetical protein
MGGCLLALAVLFFVIGMVNLLSPEPGATERPNQIPRPASFPAQAASPAAQAFNAPPAQINPPTGGVMSAQSSGNPLSHIQVGQRIRVKHPQQGELSVYVMGHTLFDELWQTRRGAQSPWVPTGNTFSAFWLETNLLLLNWQNRYYLLDELTVTSDSEIGRDFAPHARKFAQSDQTAEVLFAYPPGSWRMIDIGKFRVSRVEGEGMRQRPGGVGRFIHAHGSGREAGVQRGLVVEDYEGGGEDVVWVGYLIEATDIQA